MTFVLTVDQLDSRATDDLVIEAVDRLRGVPTEIRFARTVGDEFQGVLSDPLSVVTAILILMRDERWHIGLGIGEVEQPLPTESRLARGPAFVAARAAVERAKSQPSHLAVTSTQPDDLDATDAETVLRLLAALRQRRTPEGWQAVDLAAQGLTQRAAAERLGITRQAISQRLQTAQWSIDKAAGGAAARLLARADQAAR